MRAIAIVALTSAGVALSSLGAEAAPCCARYPEGASNCGFYRFAHAKRPSLVEVVFATKTHLRLMATSSRVNNALRADHGAAIKKPPPV